jgi:hypothetical protein
MSSNVIDFPTGLESECDICGRADNLSVSQTMAIANPSMFGGREQILICFDCSLKLVRELGDFSISLANQARSEGFLK